MLNKCDIIDINMNLLKIKEKYSRAINKTCLQVKLE